MGYSLKWQFERGTWSLKGLNTIKDLINQSSNFNGNKKVRDIKQNHPQEGVWVGNISEDIGHHDSGGFPWFQIFSDPGDVSTREKLCNQPLVPDLYEELRVEVRKSRMNSDARAAESEPSINGG